MQKIISVLLVLILVLSLFAGCGKKDANTIKIGINYELTGDVSTYGQSSVEGIELAIEEINKAGGINGKEVECVKYDTKSEAAEATTLATRLMTQDKVVAILGPATSGSFKSEIPVAEKNKIPVVSGSATAEDVTYDQSGLKEYAFRICFSDSVQGTAMAKFALENLSAKKAVIIMDSSSDYGKGLAENFIKVFKEGGGTIVAQEAYVAKDTDFNAIITKIKGEDFDVIYIPGYYNEAGLIIKQARDQGVDAPILGADGFESPVLKELAGADALNDVYYSNHYSPVGDNPMVAEFINAYKAKYNKEPDAFAALGYDAAKFLADAISRSKDLSGQSIKEALENTKDFNGLTGTFSIDEKHNAIKPVMVIGLENGEKATTVEVAY
jgi:branched-chain amino acid transport system substrate-binding protein